MSRSTMTFEDPETIIIVGLDTVEDDKNSPLYDERVDMELPVELVDSVKEHGVQQNVICLEKNGKLVCIDGRQRVRAARELNRRMVEDGGTKDDLMRVPVSRYASNGVGLMGLGITLNEIRFQDSISIKAAKLQRYLNLGRTMEDASRVFGVKVSTLQNWLSILKLEPELQEQVTEGTLSVNNAVDLSQLEIDEQGKVAAEVKQAKQQGKDPKVVARAVSRQVGKGAKFTAGPGKRLIKKLWKYEDAQKYVTQDFMNGAAWATGQIETNAVNNLDKLLKKLA